MMKLVKMMKLVNRPSALINFADNFTKRSDSSSSAGSGTINRVPLKAGRFTAPGGFTIIELLVVLAIIGLLMSLAFVQFSAARAKTRDAKREKDIKTLQDALSLYVTNAKTYPTTDASGLYLTGSDTVSNALISSGAIAAIPIDPQNTGNFRYHYVSIDGFSYILTYYLETDTVPGKSAGVQTAGP